MYLLSMPGGAVRPGGESRMAGEAGYQVASASVFWILSFLDPVECSRRLLRRFARNPMTTAGGGRDEEGWDSILERGAFRMAG